MTAFKYGDAMRGLQILIQLIQFAPVVVVGSGSTENGKRRRLGNPAIQKRCACGDHTGERSSARREIGGDARAAGHARRVDALRMDRVFGKQVGGYRPQRLRA